MPMWLPDGKKPKENCVAYGNVSVQPAIPSSRIQRDTGVRVFHFLFPGMGALAAPLAWWNYEVRYQIVRLRAADHFGPQSSPSKSTMLPSFS
jgi:hypothetical protein